MEAPGLRAGRHPHHHRHRHGAAHPRGRGDDLHPGHHQQNIADAAALNAATYLSVASSSLSSCPSGSTSYTSCIDQAAENAATDNGWSAAVPSSNVALGTYSGSTFTGGCVSSCNAVKVTASSNETNLLVPGSHTLSRYAIGTVTPSEDGMSVGSYLASVNCNQATALDSVFSITGTTCSADVVGYEGVIADQVTVNGLISASGGVLTTSNVLTQSVSYANWASYLYKAVTGSTLTCPGTGSYLQRMACAFSTNTTLTTVCGIIGLPDCGGTVSVDSLDASVNAFNFLDTQAELANKTSALSLTSLLALAGDTASLDVSVIHPPQYAYGPVGTTAESSQLNVSLSINLGVDVLGTYVSIGSLNIPLNGVIGTGTLTSITCSNFSQTGATVNVANSVASSNNVTLTLLGQSAVTVSSLAIGLGSPQNASFTPPWPDSQSVNSNGTLSFSSDSVLDAAIVNPVLSVVANSTGLVDLLQALGVNLEGSTVTDYVTPSSCGSVTLAK